MIRLLILGLALYLATKIIGGLFTSSESKTTVKGESKKERLDISEDDIVDVDYKDVKD